MKSSVFVILLPPLLWDAPGVLSFSTVVSSSSDRRSAVTSSAVATADLRSNVRYTTTKKKDPKDATSSTRSSDISSLTDLGIALPMGLHEALETNADVYLKHFWIVDNSGSMNMGDGHEQNLLLRIDTHDTATRTKDCTRWAEVQETVNCHAQLAAALGAPTDFKLLNPPKSGGPQTFRVGYCGKRRLPFANPFARRGGDSAQQIKSALAKTKPAGMTPLPVCIEQVRREVVSMLPQLRAEGSKVAIVIATDGSNHNTDNVGAAMTELERNKELIEALESLQDLPVSVVIRLCTDYQPLIDFYNSLDERMDWDLSLDVLDDHRAEAKEVYENNNWINYNLLLHRIREMGHYHPVLDLIDERPLTPREVRDFCRLLFGSYHFSTTSLDNEDNEYDPEWAIRLLEEISHIQQHVDTKKHWNPQTNEMEPWINVEQLAYKLLDD
jgi:hypothetical protein